MTDFGKSAKGPTLTDLTSVASNSTNINAVATNMQDVQDVATEINASPSLRSLMNSVLNDTITLDGLTDTNLGTLGSGQDGYALTWDWDAVTSTGEWVPAVAASPVTQLSDLDVTDPITDGDGLQWDSSLNSGSGGYRAASFAEIGADIPSPTASGGFLRATAAGTAFEMSQPVANLTSTDANAVLAANQGKALKDLIDGIGDITVVADNTARGNLTGLDVGDIIHTVSDSGFGNDWTRYQITSTAGGATFATATSVLIAKSTDFSNTNLVSIIDDAPIGTATDSAIGTVTIRPNQNGTATQLQLQCEDTSATSHLVTIEGPAHTAFGGAYTIKLPQDGPAAGQVLAQNSGNTQLEFTDTIAAASLSTQVNSTATDVRRAAVTTTTSADLTGDAQLFNVTASGVTLTLKDSVLNTGDIVTIYANGNNVTIANANVSTADGFDTVKIDGTTSAHTGNITVANGSMATVSVISATAGSSLVVVAGQGVS